HRAHARTQNNRRDGRPHDTVPPNGDSWNLGRATCRPSWSLVHFFWAPVHCLARPRDDAIALLGLGLGRLALGLFASHLVQKRILEGAEFLLGALLDFLHFGFDAFVLFGKRLNFFFHLGLGFAGQAFHLVLKPSHLFLEGFGFLA